MFVNKCSRVSNSPSEAFDGHSTERAEDAQVQGKDPHWRTEHMPSTAHSVVKGMNGGIAWNMEQANLRTLAQHNCGAGHWSLRFL